MLEMEQWPPVVKKRRVEKPTIDETYKRALCDWVATLVELAETLPQAKRPGWRHQAMALRHGNLTNITCKRIYMFTVTYTKMNI